MKDVEILMNKKKFILAVINEEINVKNVKKKDIII